MIPAMSSSGNEPCILIGGYRDGQEDMIACVGHNSPCEVKIYINPFEKYYICMINGQREKDKEGRWVLRPVKIELVDGC